MFQYPVPVITGPQDIQTQVDWICQAVDTTKTGYPGLDSIVFTEYSTQGLNTKISTYDEMLLTLNSPEVGRFKQASLKKQIWGVVSMMERNEDPQLPPYNTVIIIKYDLIRMF